MTYLISYKERHALSVAFAIFFAMITNYFLFSNLGYWMVVAAFLVSPVTRGTTLRQGILSLITMILTVLLTTLIEVIFENPYAIAALEGSIVIVAGIVVFNHMMLANRHYYIGLLFIFVLLWETYAPIPYWYTLQSRIFHISIGGIIGIFCSQFIFPTRLANDFKIGVLPTLYALKHYLAGLTSCFLNFNTDGNIISARRNQLEDSMVSEESIYPNWVFETGFNPGLRSGFRFFLIEIEQLSQLLFSMSDLIARHRAEMLPQEIASLIQQVSVNNITIIELLIRYFETNALKAKDLDFETDIITLDEALKKLLPQNLDLFDLIPDYITLIAYIKNLKDIRQLLLRLLMSITNQI